MSKVKRVYVEKKQPFAVTAKNLQKILRDILKLMH